MSAVVTIVLVLVALFVVLGVLARSSSRRKKEAQADLEREKAELSTPDILELVRQEAADAGIDEIPGADGVDLPVRLRVWRRDEDVRSICPDPSKLRFVLTSGVSPDTATEADLRLICEGVPTPEKPQAVSSERDAEAEDQLAAPLEGQHSTGDDVATAEDDEPSAAEDEEPNPEAPAE